MSGNIEEHEVDPSVNLSFNRDFIHATGLVIHRGAWLEAAATEFLEQLVDGTGVLAVIADLNFTKTIQITRVFIQRNWDEGLYQRYALKVLNAAEEAYKYRNIVAHAKWYAVTDRDDKFFAIRFRTRQQLMQNDHADLEDIVYVAERLALVEHRLLNLMASPAFKGRRMFRHVVDRVV